ncbi:MAG: restriction endonuclease subunit S [Dehalococcoidia bacterium]
MGWRFLTLEELATQEKGAIRIGPFGSALKKHEYSDTGIRVLGIEDVFPNRLVSTKRKFIPEEKFRVLSQYAVRPGDILVTNMGTVGRTCVVPNDLETSIISSHLIKVSLNQQFVFPAYVSWMLNFCPLVVAQIEAESHGAIMAGFNSALLKKLRIPLPPLAEQRRITAILDQADALRAQRRAALAQLDTLTQAIFLDMFGDPIRNPKGFPVRPMIELVDPERPISYGILMPGPDQAEGVKYVRVVDMKGGGVELSAIRKTTGAISDAFHRSLLRPGDLLMSIRGHVGRVAVVPAALDGANITQDTARLAIQGASSVFVRESLRTQGLQRWMEKHTKGVAVRGINLGDLKQMPVMLPQIRYQETFACRAVAIENLRTIQRASLAKLDELFAALQHRAFRGEL